MDNSSLGTSFDFNSQAGVMAVLASVRQSTLTGAQKNELRDLVFLYANGGGDASVRLSLEQKLTTYQLKPVVPVVATAPKPAPTEPEVVLPFGSSRPAPSFAVPAQVLTTVPTTVTAPILEEVKVPTPVVKVPIPIVELPLSVAPAQAVPVAEPASAPTPRDISVPVTAPITRIPAPAPTAMPAAFSDVNITYLDRIREIKTAVNSKVGNPVNLVDIDNAVGREYMNALLDAMKRLSGGAGQIDPAMQRLETAYQAVEVAIAAHEVAAAAPASKSTQAPILNPIVVPEPEVTETQSVKMAEPLPVLVTEPVTSVSEERVSLPPLPVEEVVKPKFDEIQMVRENDSRWTGPVTEAQAISETPVISSPAVETIDNVTLVQGFASAAAVVPETIKSGVPAASVTPVAEAAPIHTPLDLPTAAMKAGKDADPLFAKEVDDGLEQLLSDWLLFKKSGLFGTGPKGREHPMFIKMSTLPIPLLLAGRFEGSTQEIKQSITDYMNGWRYEQGIIYEQGETFEHYLRRVIKQILDLQKKHRTS